MSFFQRKDGRWVCKIPKGALRSDAERTLIYCGRGHEGEAKARRLSDQYSPRRAGQTRRAGPSFADLADDYDADHVSAQNTESTRHRNACRFDAHLLPYFGDTNAYAIDHDLLNKYVAHRRRKIVSRHGEHQVKMTTIRRELAMVRAVMSWARTAGKITQDLTEGYKLPKLDNFVQSPPTPAELVSIAAKGPPHLQRAIFLAFYSSCRPGTSELFRLKWSSVDFQNKTLFVESAKKGGIIFRVVPLHDVLFKLLQQWHREDMARTTPPEYIINWKGKQVASIKTAWNKAKAAAGIKRVMKFYSIRHASTTALITSGADPRTACGITGNTLEVMLGHYHASSSDLREKAVAGLPDLMNLPVKPGRLVRMK